MRHLPGLRRRGCRPLEIRGCKRFLRRAPPVRGGYKRGPIDQCRTAVGPVSRTGFVGGRSESCGCECGLRGVWVRRGSTAGRSVQRRWVRWRPAGLSEPWLDVFAADTPAPVFGKSGCVQGWGTGPACGHEGHGGQQAAVAGQVSRQAGALIVVAVGVVTVFGNWQEQGFYGQFGFVASGGGHGGHGEIPAPAAFPLPSFHDPAHAAAHDVGIDSVPGEHAQGTE